MATHKTRTFKVLKGIGGLILITIGVILMITCVMMLVTAPYPFFSVSNVQPLANFIAKTAASATVLLSGIAIFVEAISGYEII